MRTIASRWLPLEVMAAAFVSFVGCWTAQAEVPDKRLPEPGNLTILPLREGWGIQIAYRFRQDVKTAIGEDSIAEATLLFSLPEALPAEFRHGADGWVALPAATETVPMRVDSRSLSAHFEMGKDRLPENIDWLVVQARLKLKDGTILHCQPAVAQKPLRLAVVGTVPKLIGKRGPPGFAGCLASPERPTLFARTGKGKIHSLSLPDLEDEVQPFEIKTGTDESFCYGGGFLFVKVRQKRIDRLLVLDGAKLEPVFEFEPGYMIEKDPLVSGDGKLLIWRFRDPESRRDHLAFFEWQKTNATPTTFDLRKIGPISPLALPAPIGGKLGSNLGRIGSANPAALSPDGSILFLQDQRDQDPFRIMKGEPLFVALFSKIGGSPKFDRTGAIVALSSISTQLHLVNDLLLGEWENPAATFADQSLSSGPVFLEGAGLIAAGGSFFDGRGTKVFEIPGGLQVPKSKAKISCACFGGKWIAFAGDDGIHLFDATKRLQPGSF